MKAIATTILEMVNHLLQNHPELAPQIRLMAETADGTYRSSKQYFGLNGLDQILERWLNYDNGYFVEMGAIDGVDQSNTFHFERHRNWNVSIRGGTGCSPGRSAPANAPPSS